MFNGSNTGFNNHVNIWKRLTKTAKVYKRKGYVAGRVGKVMMTHFDNKSLFTVYHIIGKTTIKEGDALPWTNSHSSSVLVSGLRSS